MPRIRRFRPCVRFHRVAPITRFPGNSFMARKEAPGDGRERAPALPRRSSPSLEVRSASTSLPSHSVLSNY